MTLAACPMRCIACNRQLTRAAGMVGKHWIGPKCLLKVQALQRQATSDKPTNQKRLFPDGCYFDIQGEADRASMVMGVANG